MYYDRLTQNDPESPLRYITLADLLSLYDDDIVKRSSNVRGVMDYLRYGSEGVIVLHWSY